MTTTTTTCDNCDGAGTVHDHYGPVGPCAICLPPDTTERTTMTLPTLPAGWSVRLEGLIDSTIFTSPEGTQLMWSPESGWRMGRGSVFTSAPGVPAATTQKDARRKGQKWISEVMS